MEIVNTHTELFAGVAARTLGEMFGISQPTIRSVTETDSVNTDKTFIVSIYYTGSVYGEYLLAMDEQTAANVIGICEQISDDNRDAIREDLCDAMSETLNTIVGESIVTLQQTYTKLTITSPRIYFGCIRYPKFRTGRCVLKTEHGPIECHFCLDLMRLDLAASYSQAMDSLIEVNAKLKEANEHLAEQQAQLVHSAKMASVGLLASGVAHEINSPLFFVDANLTTLNDYIEVIESTLQLYESLCATLIKQSNAGNDVIKGMQLEAQTQDMEFVIDDTKELVKETRDGVTRIKGIVQGLKDFSHVDRCGHVVNNVKDIVVNTLQLISSQLPDGCDVQCELAELPSTVCNAGEVGQAIAGVVLNASQAMPTGGTVRLSATADDTTISVVVEDEGVGIPPSDIEHIFEPFFTTKQVGEGTGLGLSIAYGIFEKHMGSITIESQVDLGTKVTMRLPVHQKTAACE